MYAHDSFRECEMPECEEDLRALVLLATLKRNPERSNTEELAHLVLENLKKYDVTDAEIVRVADLNILPGLGENEGEDDDWPEVAEKIQAADIVLYATPIWWGVGSSLIQRVIERQDSLEEVYRQTGESPLYNKVAGVVITGSEDGAQHANGNLLNVLQFQGFTLPPECCAYWVGEVGKPPAGDAEKRRANQATKTMARRLARNLAFYARLLKTHPLELKPDEEQGALVEGA